MGNGSTKKQMIKRFDDIFQRAQAQIERQKNAITRLVNAQQELAAGLHEIAAGDLSEEAMRIRARRALDNAARMAAPDAAAGKDSQA